MKLALALAGLLLLAPPEMAHDVDGTWEGVINVMGGETPVIWTFKSEGEMLTGGVSQAGRPVMPIKDGKIDGHHISFTLVVDMMGEQLSIKYRGYVEPPLITLTGDAMGQEFTYRVRRKP